MRRIMYGASLLLTTDDVAHTLTRLAVAMANAQQTEVVWVPVCTNTRDVTTAASSMVSMLVGPGIPLLTCSAPWDGLEPDFSAGVALLQMNAYYPRSPSPEAHPEDIEMPQYSFDPDLDGL